MYSIKKIISKGDYYYALCPEHPNATKNGYVLLHRIVAEYKIGRLLRPDEDAHHKNENKKDNRQDNIEIISHVQHAREHSRKRK